MTALPHMLRLVVGDCGSDGHGHRTEMFVRSSLSAKQIAAAYRRGVKKVGVDLVETVATEYEDRELSREHVERLTAAGFDPEVFDKEDRKRAAWVLCDETFVEVWAFLVRCGAPSFVYEDITHKVPTLDLGGYGLFS